MSELNNKYDEVSNSEFTNDIPIKHKNKNIPIIIFLVIFTIIAIGITTVAIITKLNSQKQTITSKSEEEPTIIEVEKIVDTVKGISDYTDTYDENDLIFTDVEISNGVKCSQISNLKDKTVENAINKEIMDISSNKEFVNISSYVNANFANVLSISITYTHGDNVENVYLNYRLDTGEKIEFEDLFIDSANIKFILSQSLYKGLVVAAFPFNEPTVDLTSRDYGYVEEELLKYMASYNKEGVSSFFFTNKVIYFKIAGKEFSIFMPDFYKSIAIYNRFKTETSLYAGEQSTAQKNLFVFMETTDRGPGSRFGKYSDNMFLDFSYYINLGEELKLSEENEKAITEKINSKFNEFKIEHSFSQDKAYAYFGWVSSLEPSSVYIQLTQCEMSKNFYDSQFNSLVAEFYAYYVASGGIDIPIDSENMKSKDLSYILSISDNNEIVETPANNYQ